MADTKQILEAQNIDDYINTINITQKSFDNDKGESVKYNQVEVIFDNGDVVYLKATPELKTALYYAKNFTPNK